MNPEMTPELFVICKSRQYGFTTYFCSKLINARRFKDKVLLMEKVKLFKTLIKKRHGRK